MSKPEEVPDEHKDVIKPHESTKTIEIQTILEENKTQNLECIICCQEITDSVNKKKKKQGYFQYEIECGHN
jgi:hypothetical protein